MFMKQYKGSRSDQIYAYPSIYTIVVTFNPEIGDLFDNLNEFCDGVEKILLVDNSDNSLISNQLSDKCKEYNNIIYLPTEDNNGIGAAQNDALRYLINNKCDDDDLLLFFDQDSYIEKEQVLNLAKHLFREKNKNQSVVMLGATTTSSDSEVGTAVASHIISSGSIVSLGDFKKIGYFDEELFIDFIDFAWCWKAKSLGFKVMVDHDVFLHHQTTGQLKTIFGRGIDNPNRLYYVYRNVIISLNRYSPSFSFSFGWYKHLFLKAIFQIVVAGSKIKRSAMVVKGIWHGINGKTGKYK
ncbi:glycosyltransferase [Leuconostoc carnosum]|nr:glycosyltransferase [Leuconostoc carnosum]